MENKSDLEILKQNKPKKWTKTTLVYKGKKIYISKKYVDILDGIKIYLVKGSEIRDKVFLQFNLGGNGYAYDFIPKNEIWLEDLKEDREEGMTLLHELLEALLMKYEHKGYEKAHHFATKLEDIVRREFGILGDVTTKESLAVECVELNMFEEAEILLKGIKETGAGTNRIFEHSKNGFFMITAFRVEFGLGQNMDRNKRLEKDLKNYNLGFIPVLGYWIDEEHGNKITEEYSYFVPFDKRKSDLNFYDIAINLGKKFNQNAIVYKDKTGDNVYILNFIQKDKQGKIIVNKDKVPIQSIDTLNNFSLQAIAEYRTKITLDNYEREYGKYKNWEDKEMPEPQIYSAQKKNLLSFLKTHQNTGSLKDSIKFFYQ